MIFFNGNQAQCELAKFSIIFGICTCLYERRDGNVYRDVTFTGMGRLPGWDVYRDGTFLAGGTMNFFAGGTMRIFWCWTPF